METNRAVIEVAHDHGLRALSVLLALIREPQATIKDLASRAGLSHTTTAKYMNVLRRAGYFSEAKTGLRPNPHSPRCWRRITVPDAVEVGRGARCDAAYALAALMRSLAEGNDYLLIAICDLCGQSRCSRKTLWRLLRDAEGRVLCSVDKVRHGDLRVTFPQERREILRVRRADATTPVPSELAVRGIWP